MLVKKVSNILQGSVATPLRFGGICSGDFQAESQDESVENRSEFHQHELSFLSYSTQNRSLWRCSSQPISWHHTKETKSNTTKANNTRTKQSKLKQKNTQNAKTKQMHKNNT